MSTEEDLQEIENIKKGMYNAIKSKEVDIPDNTPFEDYASKIDLIQPGGNCSILRINTTPSDATVAFTNSNGESIPNFYNQASCVTGKTLGCTISKTGYKPFHNTYKVNQNTELSITLDDLPHKFFGDGHGLLCLTQNGELYGSGLANPNAHSFTAVVPYFSLIDTGVSECNCHNGTYTYLKNGSMYIHGAKYAQSTSDNWYDGYTVLATDVLTLGHAYGTGSLVSYIDTNHDLYLMGHNNFGEQGIYGSTVYTPTKRASNVKDFWSVSTATASYYIDENDDMYSCGYGAKQGVGSRNNWYYFAKRASNVKEVCPFMGDKGAGYITKDNELYITSDYSQFGDLYWHKIADNVKSAIDAPTQYYDLIHYIDMDNNLYGYTLGNMNSPNPLGISVSGNRAYNVLLASNVKSSTINGNTAGYINSDGDVYAAGSKNIFPGLTQNAHLFTKVYENTDVLYQILMNSNAGGTFVCLDNNGYYYAAGENSKGRLGIDNNRTKVTEFTRIYPKGV